MVAAGQRNSDEPENVDLIDCCGTAEGELGSLVWGKNL